MRTDLFRRQRGSDIQLVSVRIPLRSFGVQTLAAISAAFWVPNSTRSFMPIRRLILTDCESQAALRAYIGRFGVICLTSYSNSLLAPGQG
jgi:hypothetical protein